MSFGGVKLPPDTFVAKKPEESKREAHAKLWEISKNRASWKGKIDLVVKRIQANKSRYVRAEKATRVPWEVIAALHNMESGGSFRRHLHEGSPLSRRTRYVPKGRPKKGNPPFSWEDSTYDVLVVLKNLGRFDWSDIGVTLYRCELYNGAGYLKYHKDVNSPYLHSGTNLYLRGKYVSDGKWDRNAVSKQVGVVPILKGLSYRK